VVQVFRLCLNAGSVQMEIQSVVLPNQRFHREWLFDNRGARSPHKLFCESREQKQGIIVILGTVDELLDSIQVLYFPCDRYRSLTGPLGRFFLINF
jgi:hypothetical protein